MSLPTPVAAPQTNSDMGLVCVITNEKGVKSHAFGTYHLSDKQSIQQSYFHQIIDSCSSLYTETGKLPYVINDWADRPEYQDVTYRYNLDTAITCAAEERNIVAISLDADIPEAAVAIQQMHQNMCNYGEARLVDAFMQQARRIAQNPECVDLHNSVKMGQISTILKVKQMMQNSPDGVLIAKREEHWAERLTPVLNNTDTSVCIAVGALHLVGEGGLADRFKKAGLKVEFIQHRAPAPSWMSRISAKLGSLKNQVVEGISQVFSNSHSTNGMRACKAALH